MPPKPNAKNPETINIAKYTHKFRGGAELPFDAIGERVRVEDRHVGAGYGLPTGGMLKAVRMVAQLEGVLLDPVYTGKAMAGLFDLVRNGELTASDTVVFWHTGGSPALFAYPSLFVKTTAE